MSDKSRVKIKFEVRNNEIDPGTLITGIEAIEATRNQEIVSKKQLSELVERPLLKACEILFEKNIPTLSTSANKGNVGDFANIIIDYDNLSPENQEIGRSTGVVSDYDGGNGLVIKIKIEMF